jgi:hypothetical protein
MKLLIALSLLGTLALAAACGGDDDDTGPTSAVTPAGTKLDTPTPTIVDGGSGDVPEPSPPDLDEELTEIASDSFDTTIEAGASYTIDTVTLASEVSGDPSLSCDTSPNFAFDFTWQVQDPYPPDGVQLVWQLSRSSGNIDVANQPFGEQTVGCETLLAVNNGPTPITVAISYRAGVIP